MSSISKVGKCYDCDKQESNQSTSDVCLPYNQTEEVRGGTSISSFQSDRKSFFDLSTGMEIKKTAALIEKVIN